MGNRAFASAVTALSLVAASCGGDDEPPVMTPETFEEACANVDGCETPTVATPGPTETIWRVLVVRDAAGSVHIEEVDVVDVPESIGPPQGPLGGSHGLAALDAAGMPLELQKLSFPQTGYAEGLGLVTGAAEEDFAGEAMSVVGYLAATAEVDQIAVVEPDGTVVDSRAPPAAGEAGAAREALLTGAPGSACSHVLVLEGEEDRIWYPRALEEGNPEKDRGPYRLVAPTPTQLAVTRAALGRMTPMHCVGTGRIAFAEFPSESTGGEVKNWPTYEIGDMILVNATLDTDGLGVDEIALQGAGSQALLSHIIVHEAAHATTFLLQSEVDDAFTGLWEETERDLAAETVDRVRLRGGFSEAWLAMHQSFQALGWTTFYSPPGEEEESLTPEQMADRGFMSAYGMHNHREDIADFAAWPVSGPVHRAAELPVGEAPDTNDYGCIAMQQHMERSVPSSLAVVYTKLSFLRDLGMVSEENFSRCVGDSIGLPHDTDGFVVYEEGAVQRVFDTGPEAVIGTLDGRIVFEMRSRGTAEFGEETYPAELTLRLDLAPATTQIEKVSWPRGLYIVDPVNPHVFQLRLDGAPAGNFDVTDGFVLVARASNDLIVGSVFVRGAFRYMAPVPVPQTFDPPLQFRFMLAN